MAESKLYIAVDRLKTAHGQQAAFLMWGSSAPQFTNGIALESDECHHLCRLPFEVDVEPGTAVEAEVVPLEAVPCI